MYIHVLSYPVPSIPGIDVFIYYLKIYKKLNIISFIIYNFCFFDDDVHLFTLLRFVILVPDVNPVMLGYTRTLSFFD
jgi:hypothetical protein